MSDCNESEADIGHQQTGLPLENGGVASSLDASLESEDNQETCSALVNDVLQAANEVAREQFLKDMVYEETSGLYYDFKSGYYFDAVRSLYYDGTNGIYYQYNYSTESYEFHSQVPVSREQKEERKLRKQMHKYRHQRSSKINKLLDSDAEESSSSELEEGELLSSSSSSLACVSEDEDGAVDQTTNIQIKAEAMLVAPCIRLVVTKSDYIPKGTLYIVTSTGGTIGRFGNHDVLLDEENCCSKSHAKIIYQEEKYYISDSGSVNGTFVNSKRLSKSKLESPPFEIGHGSLITIGSTILTCHVHPGRETCLQCEPGLLQHNEKKEIYPAILKESVRKKENRAMRKKYGIGHHEPSQSLLLPQNYVDRALKRRKEVGSDNPHEKTEVADVEKSIDSRNKGFKMLSKMGWNEGQGLGKSHEGRVEPIPVQFKNDRVGLQESSRITSFNIENRSKAKMETMAKARQRFNQSESNEGNKSPESI